MIIYRPTVWSPPSEDNDHKSIELMPLSTSEDEEFFKNDSQSIKTNRTSKPSLLLALCQTYMVTFITAGFLKLINDLMNFIGPQILKLEATI